MSQKILDELLEELRSAESQSGDALTLFGVLFMFLLFGIALGQFFHG